MPQDAFSLRYLCQELNALFKGGKINRIIQPDNDQLVFTIYTGKRTEKLYISVNPSCPRIGAIEQDKQSPIVAPNFCMLLRKHLLSATIEEISLVGFDRIVKIDLLPNAEFFDAEKKTLYVELMGRYSNIILTENGKVLGANRGINVFDNGVRPLIVGREYLFPPVGDKKEPNDLKLIEYFDNFNGENLPKYLCDGVQGIALSTAKEIVSSFDKNKNDIDFSKSFFDHVNNFLYNSKINPCVIKNQDQLVDVCVYPYECIKGETISFEKLYLAEDFYFTNKEKDKLFNSKKTRLENLVEARLKKLKKKLSNILSSENDARLAEENKIKGELVLANCYNIKQGQQSCLVYDYYKDQMVEIPLDVSLTPSKNAERYYKKYNKQKRTLEVTKEQKAVVNKEIDYIQSIADEISLLETIEEADSLELELESYGIIKKQKEKVKKNLTEYRKYKIQDFTVKVGRNNLENDKLTFSAEAKDVWLHSKDYHSSHIIIEAMGRKIPLEVITVCAEICAYYSKARNAGKSEIVYTFKKNVKKPPKSKPGFCVYDNFKSIIVNAKNHAEFIKNG